MGGHETTVNLANKLLDVPYSDPDDDTRTMARAFLRADEAKDHYIARLAAAEKALEEEKAQTQCWSDNSRALSARVDQLETAITDQSKALASARRALTYASQSVAFYQDFPVLKIVHAAIAEIDALKGSPDEQA